jgi:hypothetical protein
VSSVGEALSINEQGLQEPFLDGMATRPAASRLSFQAGVSFQEAPEPLSDEHFSVDGALIEAWASMKSFRPKDGGHISCLLRLTPRSRVLRRPPSVLL